MNIYELFEQEFGQNADSAFINGVKFKSTDIINFAQKFHKSHSNRERQTSTEVSENHDSKELHIADVGSSVLLPEGFKIYKCTNCQEINIKKDNREITVGYCDNCGHPLWNDDVD